MIEFNNISKEPPYIVFKDTYEKALKANQKNIEAISISSFSKKDNEVNARFVNLKFINNKDFIFFSNYASPKSKEFDSHNQIIALIYWNSINVQIRIRAVIERASKDFNNSYFLNRDKEKNALAISSYQSNTIDSYDSVKENFKQTLKNKDLHKCPEYWGGFVFIPYYFEFWEGHKSRLNKRIRYKFEDGEWIKSYLQP